MNNKIYAEVWVTFEKPHHGRKMCQFFCMDKAETIAKVTEWIDKAVKIEVIPV